MEEKQVYITGNGDGRKRANAARNMAGKSKRVRAQAEQASITSELDWLSLVQDDLSQYQKAGGQVVIVPKNGILAILIYPKPGIVLDIDAATGHILANGKPVTYA